MYNRDTIEIDGLTFRVDLPHDDGLGEPWKEHDGHGIVSDWTTRSKRPGERIIASDRTYKRYYDFAGTVTIALRDGWGTNPAKSKGKKRRQIASESVELDLSRMMAWCSGDWQWIGVVVTLLDCDGNNTNESDSLWGIESDSGDYLESTAREMAQGIADKLNGVDALSVPIRNCQG